MTVWVHMIWVDGEWAVYSNEEFLERYRRKDSRSTNEIEEWIPRKVRVPDGLGEGYFVLNEHLQICLSQKAEDGSVKLTVLEEV